jgi:hypothetical protein
MDTGGGGAATEVRVFAVAGAGDLGGMRIKIRIRMGTGRVGGGL